MLGFENWNKWRLDGNLDEGFKGDLAHLLSTLITNN